MRSVTVILIYLAPLPICQPEIFGTVSDHVSGSARIFFFFFPLLLKTLAPFLLQTMWFKLKVPQSKICVLNPTLFPFFPTATKKKAKQPEEGRQFVPVSRPAQTHSYQLFPHRGTLELLWNSSIWMQR